MLKMRDKRSMPIVIRIGDHISYKYERYEVLGIYFNFFIKGKHLRTNKTKWFTKHSKIFKCRSKFRPFKEST